MKKNVKDIMTYFIGSLFPMFIGFLSSPIFTRYFTPDEYGILGLINITYSYINVFFISWISSCLWRYYNKFKNKNELSKLLNIIISIFFINCFILIISGFLITYLIPSLNEYMILLLLKNIALLTGGFVGYYLIILRLEGKAFKYVFFSSSVAYINFVIMLLLTFKFSWRIEAFYFSQILSNFPFFLTFLLYIGKNTTEIKPFKILLNEKKILKEMFLFGIASGLTIITQYLLSSGDRYILKIFRDLSELGIYDRVYNISNRSVFLLIGVFFNTFNPFIYDKLENDIKNIDKHYENLIPKYILFIFPIVLFVSLYSKEVAFILLGEKFRIGYTIIPFVVFGTFFMGINTFFEVKLKFTNIKYVLRGYIFATIINIILNFIFIPKFGYYAAAFTTTLSNFILLFYLAYKSRIFKLKYILINKINYTIPLIFLGISTVSFFIVRLFFNPNLLFSIIEGCFYFFMYIFITIKLNKKLLK
ncbi:hypothetical protein OSSY52_03130 [Tepiditoga spiralis]|uniref:Uncharacterized protein n=1 Tax=Tepiditoga spiralis TaxID=2108365 RepID=A0A7G1G828_9BACT|nr:oligosaccharide flippase family protein [Tepiditoga spiralis]BBE30172.1 hypothetical protein OSSY52_03130 [Tepiditoga spiralis]